MGKTAEQATEAARKDIAAVIRRFTDIAHTAVANLTDEDIQAGFALPTADAPKWTTMVERVVGSAARSETSHPTSLNQSLSVTVIGTAETTEKWLESVQAVQKKKPKLIDAQVVEKDRK